MATRTQTILPIALAAIIIGIVGILSIPSDAKLEAVEFPIGTIKIDEIVLEVQIADTEPRRVRGLMFQEELPYNEGMLEWLSQLELLLFHFFIQHIILEFKIWEED